MWRWNRFSFSKKRGWNVQGFDVDSVFANQLSKKIGVTIKSGNFIEQKYKPNSLDCIYLNHVLEHLKNPNEYLTKIHSILKTDGILHIAVPNIIQYLFWEIGISKKTGKYYDTPKHIFYYSPSVLKNILESKFNFNVIYTSNDFQNKIKPNSNVLNGYIYKNVYYKSSFKILVKKTIQS